MAVKHKLNALDLRKNAPGRYNDGGGLYLQITSKHAKSWIFRYRLAGHRSKNGKPMSREMGLGSVDAVTLSAARDKAEKYRTLVDAGTDPIESERIAAAAIVRERMKAKTFKECGEAYIAAHEAEWKHAKHRKQWKSLFVNYAYPLIGDIPVKDIDTGLVLACLEPIWSKKTVAAKRLCNHIENVLDWARARGYCEGSNPARWRAHLRYLLPIPSKIHKVRHYAALPYARIAEFISELRTRPGIPARALEFLILTGTRVGDIIGSERENAPPLRGEHIDLAAKVWTIPENKSGKEHTVPLSEAAMRVLKSMSVEPGEIVFPNIRGDELNHEGLIALIRRMNDERRDAGKPPFVDPNPKQQGRSVVPHGFRSTFRTWGSEQTNFPREILEKALAHTVGDETERSYDRGDLLDKRRRLMQAWGEYCCKPAATNTASVTPMRKVAR